MNTGDNEKRVASTVHSDEGETGGGRRGRLGRSGLEVVNVSIRLRSRASESGEAAPGSPPKDKLSDLLDQCSGSNQGLFVPGDIGLATLKRARSDRSSKSSLNSELS